jgi:LysR family glycine cleavage system transcriptional activator
MPRDLPSLNAIRAFESAARLSSFSRAADELSVTQSAVSRQIQKLEAELGQALFSRNGPHLKLTDRGREYYTVVQQGLGVIKRGTERLFRHSAPVLTITATPSAITNWLVPRVSDLERRLAGTSLHLNSSTALVDFAVSTDIDVGIRFGNGRWPNVTADLLVDDVVFPVCRADVARRMKRPSDLLGEQLLTEDPNWDLWADWFAAAGVAHKPSKPLRLSDDFTQPVLRCLGHGVTPRAACSSPTRCARAKWSVRSRSSRRRGFSTTSSVTPIGTASARSSTCASGCARRRGRPWPAYRRSSSAAHAPVERRRDAGLGWAPSL